MASSSYTYKGFSTISKDKLPFTVVDKELVKRDILNHFMTRKGERIMLPNFGSMIHELLMDPSDAKTESLVEEDVMTIIGSDPRVKLKDLQISNSEHSLELKISIEYLEMDDLVDELFVNFIKDLY